jgi:two-component system, NarL family, nitrate/nitrite response regulator NarL
MRVILVGTSRQRHALRVHLDGAADVVAEFDTLAEAQDAAVAADALLLPVTAPVPPRDDLTAIEPLTPREIEVLELVTEGLSNKAIAERLGISSQTVKFHVASILGKLGASNRTEAVRRAVRMGLVTL